MANIQSYQLYYVRTNDADDEEKDVFYRSQEELDKVLAHDVLCVMGDMNAKVGDNYTNRERVMGNHGCGALNDNAWKID